MTTDTLTWHAVAKPDEIAEDSPRAVTIGDRHIALYRVDGELYATSNVCTHQFALLTDGFVDGDIVECPLHGARFHIPTGEVLDPPADEDLDVYAVKIDGDTVYVGVKEA